MLSLIHNARISACRIHCQDVAITTNLDASKWTRKVYGGQVLHSCATSGLGSNMSEYKPQGNTSSLRFCLPNSQANASGWLWETGCWTFWIFSQIPRIIHTPHQSSPTGRHEKGSEMGQKYTVLIRGEIGSFLATYRLNGKRTSISVLWLIKQHVTDQRQVTTLPAFHWHGYLIIGFLMANDNGFLKAIFNYTRVFWLC